MSQRALDKYKGLVDRIDVAFRIGDIEGEACLEDVGPKLEMWMDRMDNGERKQAADYLKNVAKQHKAFKVEFDMDDDEEEDDMGECRCSKCQRPNITSERKRELTKFAMELAELVDRREIKDEERGYLMTMLDNLV